MSPSFKASKKTLLLALEVFLWILFGVGAAALVRTGRAYGHDFRVFWNAGHNLITGLPVYDVVRDGAMTFKFPPWTVAGFMPLGLLPQNMAAWAWAGLQILCILWIGRWCILQGASRWSVYVCGLLFWGVWVANTLDGQVNLPILATLLALTPRPAKNGNLPASIPFSAGLLSAKIFGVVGMLGFPFSSVRKPKSWALFFTGSAAVVVLLFFLPVLTGSHASVGQMIESWLASAASGGSQFGDTVVRGRFNQGLPSLPLKLLKMPAEKTQADVISFLCFASLSAAAMWAARKRLVGVARWSVGLGLASALHPLAWAHLFAFAFPLAVFAVDRSFRDWTSMRRIRLARLAGMGLAMVALMTNKTLGEMGGVLEYFCIKSFGVILLATVLYSLGPKAESEFS